MVLQALEWIHDTGEFYLSTHTNVGENLTETEALLKEHNEFKVTAKVSVECFDKYSVILGEQPHAVSIPDL